MGCEEQSPKHLVHLSAVSQIVYIDPTAEIHAPGSLVTPPCSWNANDHLFTSLLFCASRASHLAPGRPITTSG